MLLATDVALASNAKASSCSSASNGAHSDWSAALLPLLPLSMSMLTDSFCDSTTVTTAVGVLAPPSSVGVYLLASATIAASASALLRVTSPMLMETWVGLG